MKLSLGPILYYWSFAQVEKFYHEIKDTSADIIYLGETVCAKRQELRTSDWLTLAADLCESGKQVVLSTLALIEARADITVLKKICDNSPCLIEANDMAAVQLLAQRKLPFVAGPSINIYNAYTLALLYKQGMQRWVMPVELQAETLREILDDARNMGFAENIETEVFSYGKLPLAYSARCFTARAKNLSKDNCALRCLDYPDGLLMKTQEDNTLFTLNGIQTQSGSTYNLLNEWQKMQDMGVDIMRISPQLENTPQLISRFAETIRTGVSPLSLVEEDQCNGYWYGNPGMDTVSSPVIP